MKKLILVLFLSCAPEVRYFYVQNEQQKNNCLDVIKILEYKVIQIDTLKTDSVFSGYYIHYMTK